MGIDRIGKGGAPPAAPETQGAGSIDKKSSVDKTFSVDRTEAARQTAGVAAAETAEGASALERLRAGEIDVNTYVDLKIDAATSNLEGLSPEELADLKDVLREQLITDPGLTDLARTATGRALPDE